MDQYIENDQLKMENDELIEKLEKNQINYNLEIQNEKEKFKKLQQENIKLTKSIKDLKDELQNYEQQLTQKENECIELNNKILQDSQIKNLDSNIFLKLFGRQPVEGNIQDQKIQTIINFFENQKDRLVKEISYWKKECIELGGEAQEQKDDNDKLSDEERNKYLFFEKVKEELMNQVNSLQEKQENLQNVNLKLANDLDLLQRKYDILLTENEQLKERDRLLRMDYLKIENKILDQYLQFQSINSEKNMNSINTLEKNDYNESQSQQSTYGDENVNTLNNKKPYQQNNSHKKQLSSSSVCQDNQTNHNEPDLMNQYNSINQRQSDHKSSNHCSNSLILQQSQQEQISQNQIISQLCEIYSVETEDELIQCAQKTVLVIQAIPQMESLLQQISEIVFGNNNSGNQYNEYKQERNIERIVPILQKWKVEIKLIHQFVAFKDKLCQYLQINNQTSTDKDILQQIEFMKAQMGSSSTNQTQCISQLQSSQSLEVKKQKQVFEFMKLLDIGEEDNMQQKIQQILLKINDISRFIKITKKILDLDEDMRQDACLSYILKLLEKMKTNKYNDPDLMLKIQKTLNVNDPQQILIKLESMLKYNKTNIQHSYSESIKNIKI